jgi:hypothetical protein
VGAVRDGERPYGHLSVAQAARRAQLHAAPERALERGRLRKLQLRPDVAVRAHTLRNWPARQDPLRDLAVLVAHPAKELRELFIGLSLGCAIMKMTFYMEWAMSCCHRFLPYRMPIDIRFQT